MKDILVAILEDDEFSRNWMSLLMVHDWRTRLTAEFSSHVELCDYLNRAERTFDVLILDVDLFGENFTVEEICHTFDNSKPTPKILLTGVKPNRQIVQQMGHERVSGYVLKHEVGYSLSWILTFLYEGHWVLTPGTAKLALDMNFQFPEKRLILDGRNKIPGFTDHESEVARFAFIFSLGRRDLADELKISEQWSYGLVSSLYEKMGLGDIISGEADLFSYIGESTIIRSHFEEIIDELGDSKKARDMETLAYHLLTMPQIIA